MRVKRFAIVGLGLCVAAAGCARITTHVVEKPRVDQELQGNGNRGFLTGSAPQPTERKTTRQIIQTDVELPTSSEMNPWKKQQKTAAVSPVPVPPAVPQFPVLKELSPSRWQEPEQEPFVPTERSVPKPIHQDLTPSSKTYTVKSGDTLDKIAAKIYGDANQWRRIFEANKDKLKTPNKIYPGQKLVIPPFDSSRKKTRAASPSESDLK